MGLFGNICGLFIRALALARAANHLANRLVFAAACFRRVSGKLEFATILIRSKGGAALRTIGGIGRRVVNADFAAAFAC